MFSFTSGLFDSVFARVSAFKVFGFSGIIWAFRKFGFFRDSIFCIRADKLALVTAGEGGGGGGGGRLITFCLQALQGVDSGASTVNPHDVNTSP